MSDTMKIEEYLEQGGVLSSPENAPARYRGELMRMMSSFVDSELAASAGFASSINYSPNIQARIAASRITLEKADHAQRVLEIMRSFGTDVERYEQQHDWAARLPRDSALPTARQGSDMRLSVFYFPLINWVDAVVMNVLQGLAAEVQLESLSKVSYGPLAEVFRDIAPREQRHAELGQEGLAVLVKAGQDTQQIKESLAYWRPRVAAGFGQQDSARYPMLCRLGLRHDSNSDQLQRWETRVNDHLQALGLTA
ncbi:Phenylacetic acid catabolic protein [Paenalcaligenes suwonensis]|uniref:Phenylacetic acid catabolic protein n=1 Tax=Paenalcaligenes suwonensis TaxID=1202713 RepID=UPI0014073807|nr:Phenylacetic acid catabolic protein [Paenalcaligenes suwonensis]NHC60321.1 phenylacetic acid catabolic [Paenalcaligenes suwonensis]